MRTKAVKFFRGVVLVELIVAVVIIGLLTMLAFMNTSGLVVKNQFDTKVTKLTGLMEMACNSARQTSQRYEMVFDPANQYYELREFAAADSNEFDAERLIESGEFDENFFLSYIQFDDFEMTEQETAIFRIGIAGFQYGGKIVVLDENAQPHSIVVGRIDCDVEVYPDDVELMVPIDKDDLAF